MTVHQLRCISTSKNAHCVITKRKINTISNNIQFIPGIREPVHKNYIKCNILIVFSKVSGFKPKILPWRSLKKYDILSHFFEPYKDI